MTKILASIGLAVAAIAIAVYLVSTIGGRSTDPQDAGTALDEAKDRLARSAAISRIAAESRLLDAPGEVAANGDTDPAPQAAAPQGFVPAPLDIDEPVPPEGYAFASYHQVARGPLTAADIDRERPADPPEWMTSGTDALAELAAASGRRWTFGWVKLADGARLEGLESLLAARGGQVLGRAGDLVRVRVPADASSLQMIAAARSVVAGIGAVPPERKITETLAERAAANVGEEFPVWITLMSDDPDGRWRRVLKELGAEVGRFDPAIRSYAATIPLAALGPVSEADFVLAVESIGRVEPTLEIAAPSMGADALRSYDAAAGTFVGTGGASVPVGVMDTGFNIDHPDLSSNRRSICGANFVTDNFSVHGFVRETDADLWFDSQGHGSHVAGVVFGNGAVARHRVGMAPLVQDIRIAKAVGATATALAWSRAMDWFAAPTACGGDGVARKALVIPSSLGVSSDEWQGRSAVERKIDASVWTGRQLFVTSAANSAERAYSIMGAAKNALTVGSAQKIGDIAGSSSRGPTDDGRLLPNIVGTGVSVASARGTGARKGYVVLSGTSFSSPAVVGVAALVMDAVPELKEEPAALRARLMASAIKPDAFLGDASAFPLDNTHGPGTLNHAYGLGKVSARTAVLSRDDEDGWTGGSAAFDMDADSHAYHDIVVPDDASRLDVVMTWDEPPAETIANSVLHDLDLWVDRHASCGDIAACGHYASRSRIDNVEWVVVPNPPAGVYRIKVLPNRIYGATPRAGLAWTVIRGDSTPTLGVAVDSDVVRVAPDVPFEVDVTMSSDAYVAAGANLRVDCRTEVGSTACDELSYDGDDSAVHREDGLERPLARDGLSVVVGEIGPDERQAVTLRFPGQPEGSFRLHITASAWNAASDDASVAVVVGEPETDLPAPVQRPPNDDFANAIELDGTGGETTFDLVAATPEPGEPAYYFVFRHPHRARSLWYVWTAPETGPARFGVPRSTRGDYSDYVIVEVFRDGPIAGLQVASEGRLGGGTTFFATQGETYRIRLSVHGMDLRDRWSAMPDLTLRWGPGGRPENDDYAFAAQIEGESGAVAGTTQAATMEPAEFMGNSISDGEAVNLGWTSSVWYRWTSPSTGDYRFSVNRESQVVAAFVGDGLPGARMVSGLPARGVKSDGIVFPATEGVEYRIGLATGSATWAGADFDLSWAPGARALPRNDDVAAAAPTSGGLGFGTVAFNDMTVEHGEPPASGVRTAWWRWQPSADGRYTWLVDQRGAERSGFHDAPLQMAVFAGDGLPELDVVAMDEGDETMELQLAFDARADTAYRVALGLPRDAAQASVPPMRLMLAWGPTPANDDVANAAPLVGMSGTVSGSNRFATIDKGEHTGSLGSASLWWTFAPEESSWIRFELDGPAGSKLAIYRIRADGGMELVRASRVLETVAATVRVEAGERYVVRYGTTFVGDEGPVAGERGPFELAWRPADPPASLRFVDAYASGQIAASGQEIGLDTPGDQAFNGDGTELYVASAAGILVFERDPATGELSLSETLADHPVDPDTQMIWDEAGAALLVAGCDGWLKFTPAQGGGIEHVGSVAGAPCPTGPVLVRGDFAYHVDAPYLIETLRFDEGHDAVSSAGIDMIEGVVDAVMTADGANIYALADAGRDTSLAAIERDSETGSLRIVRTIEDGSPAGGDAEGVVEGLANASALAVDGSHLFVLNGSNDVLAFDLADRGNPVFLGSQPSFVHDRGYSVNVDDVVSDGGGGVGPPCYDPLARRDVAAVDVACANRELYTVQVGRDGSLLGSDRVGFLDGFGNIVYGIDGIASFAASPDGRHVYLAGTVISFEIATASLGDFGLLTVFERVYGD